MTRLRTIGLLAVASVVAMLALSGPAVAQGDGGGHEGDGRADDVPARIAVKLRRALRAMDRAGDHIDDGEYDKAVRSLTSVRRNLATAVARTNHRVGNGADSAPAAAHSVAVTVNKIVEQTVAEMDGASGDLDDALAATLDAAVDGRASVVSAIGGVSSAVHSAQGDGEYERPKSSYERALMRIVNDAKSELTDIDESLDEDQLTAKTRAALETATGEITDTKKAAKEILDSAVAPAEPKPEPDKPAA